MSFFTQNILPWVLTFGVEFFILLALIRKEPLRLFLISLLINSFTLPVASNVYQNFFSNLAIIEIAVFISESLLLMWLLKIKYPKALIVAFVANLATTIIGLFLYWPI